MWENWNIFFLLLFKIVLPAALPAQGSRFHPSSRFHPHPSREQGTIPARRGWRGSPPCRDVSRARRNPCPWIFSAGWPPAEPLARPFKSFSCSAAAPAEGLLSQPPFLDRNCHFSEHSFPSPGPEPSASLTSARLCDAPAGILRSWFFSLP